jgi:serine/tyrosine/threonine adenylyltransferase
MSTLNSMKLNQSYSQLPASFYSLNNPKVFVNSEVLIFNDELVNKLGAEITASEIQKIVKGQYPGLNPLSQAYAGHQFGHFNILGDGRAHVLGEFTASNGLNYDLALKGSGRSIYSRGGDGLAAIGPMLREYLISEFMHAVGISTTRSLTVIKTNEPVLRESVLPGAVLFRIARSHLRVGTFQWAHHTENLINIKFLADFAIARHYPHLQTSENPYVDLFREVAYAQALLISNWMLIGFVHGVMNTDNMTISGETIDYGPCAFIDSYSPDACFSSIDRNGRYAYGNQPSIAQWNLTRFAETLLPLFDSSAEKSIEIAKAILSEYNSNFNKHYLDGLRKKLGWTTSQANDEALIGDFFRILQENNYDYTSSFFAISDEEVHENHHFSELQSWRIQWLNRLNLENTSLGQAKERMKIVNPRIIPRNHLVDEALNAATSGDLTLFNKLLTALQDPFEFQSQYLWARNPQNGHADTHKTFCGT